MSVITETYRDREGTPYQVRDARPEDAAALVALLDRVGREEIYIADESAQISEAQQAEILRRLNPEVQLVLVLEQHHVIVGSLEMIRGTFRKNRHTAIFGMALLPESRGHGLGEGLLRTAERWAQDAGVMKISLAVFSSNRAAIRLYQRLGYQEEGRRLRQYLIAGKWVDEIWMARWL